PAARRSGVAARGLMGTILGPRPPWDESREPILRAPRVVTVFILIWLVVHIGTLFLNEQHYEWLILNYPFIPPVVASFNWSHFGFNSDTLHLLVPFVSYAFLHGDFMHVLFNSVWFLIFATAVARRIGTWRFLVFSFITAVAAAL